MSQSRTAETSADFKNSILKASFAAGFAHPSRVLLNRASLFTSVSETILKSKAYIFSGMPINVIRGGSAIGLQDYVKDVVKQHSGAYTPLTRALLGITATSLAGVTVASTIETALIRKTIISKSIASAAQPALMRMTPILPVLYFSREVGFSLIMFYSNDLPAYQRYSLMLGGACYTGMMHKFATLEATRDLLPPSITTPNFAKDGVFKTVSDIANGRYTHPAMSVKYQNPDNLAKKTHNFFSASCGMRMFTFRCNYLLWFYAGMRVAEHMQKGKLKM